MLRVLAVTQRVNPVVQLDVIVREVRMAESDLSALIVEYELAPDELARDQVVQKRNQTMRWLAVLMHAMVDVLEDGAPVSTGAHAAPLTCPDDNVDIQ